MIGDVHYLNSGDWVESSTALVEHLDGRFEVLEYDDFCERLKAKEALVQKESKVKRYAVISNDSEASEEIVEDSLNLKIG